MTRLSFNALRASVPIRHLFKGFKNGLSNNFGVCNSLRVCGCMCLHIGACDPRGDEKMTSLKVLENSLFWQRHVLSQSRDPVQIERVKRAIVKLETQIKELK